MKSGQEINKNIKDCKENLKKKVKEHNVGPIDVLDAIFTLFDVIMYDINKLEERIAKLETQILPKEVKNLRKNNK